MDILKAEGLEVRIITFPDDLDPDEYVQIYGKSGFDRLKDAACTLNEFKIRSMAKKKDLTNEDDRERFALNACAFIAGLEPVEQERYYKLVSQMTGYAVEMLQAQGQRSGGFVAASQQAATRSGFRRRSDAAEDARIKTERTLVAACLADPKARSLAGRENAKELLRTDAFRALLETMTNDPAFSLHHYVSGLDQKDAELVSALLQEENTLHNPVKTVEDCIRKLKGDDSRTTLEDLQRRLTEPGLSQDEKNEILKEITKQVKAQK